MTDVPIREPWIPTNCVKAYAFTRGRSFTDIFGRSSRAWVSYSERRARALRAVGRLSPRVFLHSLPGGPDDCEGDHFTPPSGLRERLPARAFATRQRR